MRDLDATQAGASALLLLAGRWTGSRPARGADRKRCREAVQTPWKEIQESADRWNAPCEFTTFIAYEYSPTPDGSKLHHNVVFRGSEVMESPLSSRAVP